MSGIRDWLSLFSNNANVGRDQTSIMSSGTIGMTAILLNGILLSALLPLMLDSRDRDLQMLTENIEFGQVLALLILGGVAGFATFLIPVRLSGVFLGPRLNRYFDQIVLSGISPMRFLIGNVVSQNLYLGLVLFLLLPWIVLIVSLGGLQWNLILASLFLLWIYSIMLALLMLWLSLYFNELLALVFLLFGACALCGLGCAPIPYQPFVMTPFPLLIREVFLVTEMLEPEHVRSFSSVFLSCLLVMTGISVVALVGLQLGPLYGFTKENSTFGEVVRVGDSRKKRRFRFRLHIQRPSEIAFLYENRGETLRSCEGLLRWGIGFAFLVASAGTAWGLFVMMMEWQTFNMKTFGYFQMWMLDELSMTCLILHSIPLAGAILLFSHGKNTTYMSVPFMFGKNVEVSRLDTAFFVILLILQTAVTVAYPAWYAEQHLSTVNRTVAMVEAGLTDESVARLLNSVGKGTAILNVSAIVICLIHRTNCLFVWMKSASFAWTVISYCVLVVLFPMMLGVMMVSADDLNVTPVLRNFGPWTAMLSPVGALSLLFDGLPRSFVGKFNSLPFYAGHAGIALFCVLVIRKRGPRLRMEYQSSAVRDLQ